LSHAIPPKRKTTLLNIDNTDKFKFVSVPDVMILPSGCHHSCAICHKLILPQIFALAKHIIRALWELPELGEDMGVFWWFHYQNTPMA